MNGQKTRQVIRLCQINAGIGGGELPVGLGVFLVALVLPCGDFLDQTLLVGDAPVEALRRQHAELAFSQVQPAAAPLRLYS
jgi:hypothetical protein